MSANVAGNIGRGARYWQRKAFRRLKRWAGRAAVYFLQEIGEADQGVNEPKRLRKVFGRNWRKIKVRTHTPIVLNRLVWKVTDVEVIKVVDGEPDLWPAKYILVVRGHRRGMPWWKRAWVNTHFVPAAWNGRWDRKERKRRKGWRHQWGTLREVVDELVDVEGRDTVVAADTNRQGRDFPQLHRRAELVAHEDTDRMWAIPAPGRRVVAGKEKTKPLHIDFHQGLKANVRFKRKA